LYVGIDVAKATLDLARSDAMAAKDVQRYDNDDAGIAAIVKMLLRAKPVMIVIESTGGLERPLLAALLEADLPAALVHAGRVRDLARAMGILAKTDRIDARVLVLFGQKAEPRLTQRLARNRVELGDLINCRRQLSTTLVQQSNRRGSTFSAAARRSIDAIITALQKQIARLDRQIRQLIEADDDFRDLDRILRSASCAARPASVPPSPPRWWPRCRNWAKPTVSRSARSSAWRRSPRTRAPRSANAASAAAAPTSATCCTWSRWRRCAAIQSSKPLPSV
jgi:transposase